jgi:hypothetical protein
VAIDAFSSDAIPVHLLTREALALYRSRLPADGVIAWHYQQQVSRSAPVLEALAGDARLIALICDDAIVPPPSRGRFPSTWVVHGRRPTSPRTRFAATAAGFPLASGRRPKLWTTTSRTFWRRSLIWAAAE